jgi:hypothetical protein
MLLVCDSRVELGFSAELNTGAVCFVLTDLVAANSSGIEAEWPCSSRLFTKTETVMFRFSE